MKIFVAILAAFNFYAAMKALGQPAEVAVPATTCFLFTLIALTWPEEKKP